MSVFWRTFDPLLLRLRNRLEHLALHSPSDARERALRLQGRIPASTRLFPSVSLVIPDPSHLIVGDHCFLRGDILLETPEARCTIGDHCFLGEHSQIWAKESVTIGSFVLIAHMVDIHDNDSHSLQWHDRREDALDLFERGKEVDWSKITSAPVVIEDDVWIGMKSCIMKGVRIGRGAVVAAGSIVTRDVAPFTLVAGNPAREVKKLDE